ncbi:MAG: hypothetical protein AAF797_08470 [Planctomycetota bacterium]
MSVDWDALRRDIEVVNETRAKLEAAAPWIKDYWCREPALPGSRLYPSHDAYVQLANDLKPLPKPEERREADLSRHAVYLSYTLRFEPVYQALVSDRDIEHIGKKLSQNGVDKKPDVRQQIAAAFAEQCQPSEFVLPFRGEAVRYVQRWERGDVLADDQSDGIFLRPTIEVDLTADEYERLTAKLTDEDASGDPHDTAENLAAHLSESYEGNGRFAVCTARICGIEVRFEVHDVHRTVFH